ncbi:MAG: CoA pyrophosphatase [Pseudomonadota bacterium]
MTDELLATQRAFSADDFRSRFQNASASVPLHQSADAGDHRLNSDFQIPDEDTLKKAAVLMGVIDRPEGATVLMTRRADHLATHRSQVAFPGGKIDLEDPSPEATALRETWEEVGIGEANIEVLGRSADYISGSGFRIKPVLAIVRPEFELVINEDEVAEAFEVPLAHVMNRESYTTDSRVWGGKARHFYRIPYDPLPSHNMIWGVTAGIMRSVLDRLYP